MVTQATLPTRPLQSSNTVSLARALAAQATRKEASAQEEMRTTITSSHNQNNHNEAVSPNQESRVFQEGRATNPAFLRNTENEQILFDATSRENAKTAILIEQARTEIAMMVSGQSSASAQLQTEAILIQEETYQADSSVGHLSYLTLVKKTVAQDVHAADLWARVHNEKKRTRARQLNTPTQRAIQDERPDRKENSGINRAA